MTTVSIVVSTLNRAEVLARCLESLRWLAHDDDFEVVVVAGPSSDGTDDVLAALGDAIEVVRCDVANLSASRNLGISRASGDIVAFLDDDAVPEPEWLLELLPAFDDPAVGAAGGFVLNHDGIRYQYRYGLFDRLGWPVAAHDRPTPGYVFPGSWVFPHLIGTNAAFRRDALAEIDGFDEEYEYFLDDTDVVVRLIDRGWDVRQVAGAHVHHKFAPSAIRAENRVAADRRSILKNHVYFGLRHATAYLDRDALDREHHAFVIQQRGEVETAVEEGRLETGDLERFDATSADAVARGRSAAQRPPVLGLAGRSQGELRPFPGLVGAAVERVVLDDPEGSVEMLDEARALAADGQIVHLLRPAPDLAFVDFQHGVWVHGVVIGEHRSWDSALTDERERVTRRFGGGSAAPA